jgi:hypothetical protein
MGYLSLGLEDKRIRSRRGSEPAGFSDAGAELRVADLPGTTRQDVENLSPDVRRFGANADDGLQMAAKNKAAFASSDREPPRSGAVSASGATHSFRQDFSPAFTCSSVGGSRRCAAPMMTRSW